MVRSSSPSARRSSSRRSACPTPPIFLGALAIGFGIVFLVDPTRPAPLIPAILLALFAFLTLYGRGDLMPAWFQPLFVPLLFIALGVYLLLEKRAT